MKKGIILSSISILVAIGAFFAIKNLAAIAANVANFKDGNIMSDAVMANYTSMSEAQIQTFLKSKNHCNDRDYGKYTTYTAKGLQYSWRDGRFVCMADENFNGESAARIIWQAAQDYRINPQVLIVLLEKEQGLITDTWPNWTYQYKSATGYGCPDTAACDSQYFGFKNQVRNAAHFFRAHLDNNRNWNWGYDVGWNNILYSPNCTARKSVYIENKATAALYIYTPYTPTQEVLNAGYGTVSGCSAYGNRNFWLFFTDWFGSTTSFVVSYELRGAIGEKFNSADWIRSKLGQPTMNESCTLKNWGCYQTFTGGTILWSEDTKAHILWGAIRDKFYAAGNENGFLGYPISDEICGLKDNGCYQLFQSGSRIYWSEKTGAKFMRGAVLDRFLETGGESRFLGYPTSDEVCGLKNGGCYQSFSNYKAIMWSNGSGAWETTGGIRGRWEKTGFENGKMGYPTGPEKTTSRGWYQQYQNGIIIGTEKTGFYEITNTMKKRWDATGGEKSWFGYPTSPEVCGIRNGGCYQNYENIVLIYSPQSGIWETTGGIRDYWRELGFENGKAGYPTGPERSIEKGAWSQTYENGTIFYSEARGGWFEAK